MNDMENFGHLPYIHVFYLAWSWQIKDDWSTFWENFYTFDETVAMFPDQTSLSVLSMINESLSFFLQRYLERKHEFSLLQWHDKSSQIIVSEGAHFHVMNDTFELRLIEEQALLLSVK